MSEGGLDQEFLQSTEAEDFDLMEISLKNLVHFYESELREINNGTPASKILCVK